VAQVSPTQNDHPQARQGRRNAMERSLLPPILLGESGFLEKGEHRPHMTRSTSVSQCGSAVREGGRIRQESIVRGRLAPPPENKKAPSRGLFVFSPSVVEDENPVRPTRQRSCQLARQRRRRNSIPPSPPNSTNRVTGNLFVEPVN
jgi:hypothetical protein